MMSCPLPLPLLPALHPQPALAADFPIHIGIKRPAEAGATISARSLGGVPLLRTNYAAAAYGRTRSSSLRRCATP
ncbi:hypothetical protein EVAR_81598_1 [Eumeta japonica]|uniref:Uncharacterized protein n=1 Tax=Eumeta variegata TaxID=151549 RepID=A0A4C1WCC1_EUMVA|nr:hypothetical protein EVAR_81598_1 [Eumeta japonica]